jgi:hypothetical protein
MLLHFRVFVTLSKKTCIFFLWFLSQPKTECFLFFHWKDKQSSNFVKTKTESVNETLHLEVPTFFHTPKVDFVFSIITWKISYLCTLFFLFLLFSVADYEFQCIDWFSFSLSYNSKSKVHSVFFEKHIHRLWYSSVFIKCNVILITMHTKYCSK